MISDEDERVSLVRKISPQAANVCIVFFLVESFTDSLLFSTIFSYRAWLKFG